MNINEMHERIQTLKNEGQATYFAPEEIDRALNDGSNDKFNEEMQDFERTSKISSNLRNFKKQDTITLTSGFGALPGDYYYPTNALVIDGDGDEHKVDIVPESEWVERIGDPIDVVDETHPICSIRDEVEVRPDTLTGMELFYLRKPATMVFGYTTDGDNNNIYDSGTSTDCDWPDNCHMDIVRRACVYLGIPLSNQLLTTLEVVKKQTERA